MNSTSATLAQGEGNPLLSMLPIILVIVLMYILIILPQKKRQKKHKMFLDAIRPGSKVLTSGGMIGTVMTVSDKTVEVEIAPGIIVTLVKPAILSNAADIA
ncbi:MAG: preprotein translocase subunit YajC [Leptospirillum sp.]|jgi:preprotein translocase subunit YajC|nr:preprotein translocase subunit YajC [Nitrospiraceae bacterium]